MSFIKTGGRLFSSLGSSVRSKWMGFKFERDSRKEHVAAAKAVEQLGYKCVVYDKKSFFRKRSDFGSSSRYGLVVFGMPSGDMDVHDKRAEVNSTIASALSKLRGEDARWFSLVEAPQFSSSVEKEAKMFSEIGPSVVNFFTYHRFFAKPIYGKQTHLQFMKRLKSYANFPELLDKAKERRYTMSGQRQADEFSAKLSATTRKNLLGEINGLIEMLSTEASTAYAPGVRPEHKQIVSDGVEVLSKALRQRGFRYSAIVGRGSVFRGKEKPGDLDLSVIGVKSGEVLPTFDMTLPHQGGKLRVNENFPVSTSAISLFRLPTPEFFAAFTHSLVTSVPLGEGKELVRAVKARQKYIRWLRAKLPLYRKKSLWMIREHLKENLEGFREKNERDKRI